MSTPMRWITLEMQNTSKYNATAVIQRGSKKLEPGPPVHRVTLQMQNAVCDSKTNATSIPGRGATRTMQITMRLRRSSVTAKTTKLPLQCTGQPEKNATRLTETKCEAPATMTSQVHQILFVYILFFCLYAPALFLFVCCSSTVPFRFLSLLNT